MMTSLRKLAVLSVGVVAMTLVGVGSAAAEECKRGSEVLATEVFYFDTNSTTVSPADKARLNEIAKQYQGNPSLEICALGQADKSGNADYNKKLALRRAEAVANILKADGLQDAQYQIKSRGEAFASAEFLKEWFGDGVTFKSDRRVELLVMIQ